MWFCGFGFFSECISNQIHVLISHSSLIGVDCELLDSLTFDPPPRAFFVAFYCCVNVPDCGAVFVTISVVIFFFSIFFPFFFSFAVTFLYNEKKL